MRDVNAFGLLVSQSGIQHGLRLCYPWSRGAGSAGLTQRKCRRPYICSAVRAAGAQGRAPSCCSMQQRAALLRLALCLPPCRWSLAPRERHVRHIRARYKPFLSQPTASVPLFRPSFDQPPAIGRSGAHRRRSAPAQRKTASEEAHIPTSSSLRAGSSASGAAQAQAAVGAARCCSNAPRAPRSAAGPLAVGVRAQR